ncbi:phage tail spike protein [Halobacillus sp. Marseille-P3879]|uniref:phage tail spike protein n=1 Tax=Halobacillus sp. Marseille-P3879 TaxID=2045014 RepID=UPI000C7C650D|nr:phage tail spike protein [Halobacillus sp. Marseille-P3879]
MWFVLDAKYKPVGILDNTIPNGCPILNDNRKEQILNGYNTLTFDVPVIHKTASLLETEGFVVFTDDNGSEFYRIKRIREIHGEQMIKTVECEPGATADLLTQRIRPVEFTSQNLTQVVSTLLANTGWELGESYYDNVVTIQYQDYPTSLDAIHQAIEAFDAEIEFKVEFNGTRIVRKVVNLYDKRGSKTNKIFEYGNNLQGVRRLKNTDQLFTAMIGIRDGMMIKDKAVGDPKWDKFETGDDFVADPEALELYGNNGKHIFGIYQDNSASSPTELYNNTCAQLEKHNKPQYKYEVDISLIGNVSIGDTIMIKDRTFEPELYLNARVLEKISSTTEPEKGSVVLGEYAQLRVDPIVAAKRIQQSVTMKQNEWTKAKEMSDQLDTRVGNAEEKITEDAMVKTVMSNPSYQNSMDEKANAEELGDKVSKDELDQKAEEINSNTDDKIANIDYSPYATKTELTQSAESFDFKISKSNGTNLINNSVGYADMDFWYTGGGTPETIQNDELKKIGAGSGFHFKKSTDWVNLYQDIKVSAGQEYTMSWYVKATNSDNRAYVIVYNGDMNDDRRAFSQYTETDVDTDGYKYYSATFIAQEDDITLRVGSNDADATFTNIMLNEGDSPRQWSMANGEIYNTNVRIDMNGIKVNSFNTKGYTAITPEEFSGYSEVADEEGNVYMEKVFTLNGDVTEVSKVQVDKEINIKPVKMVVVDSPEIKGLAFIPSID